MLLVLLIKLSFFKIVGVTQTNYISYLFHIYSDELINMSKELEVCYVNKLQAERLLREPKPLI